jgi:uncharacterized protein
MKEAVETREIQTDGIEIREENDTRTIQGYAVKWGKRSHKIMNRFYEQFQKGSFVDSLTSDDVRALWSHDTSKVLGRTGNKTLRLEEDEVGLRFELDLPNTTLGNDTYESIKRGDVNGVSFGFRAEHQEWENRGSSDVTRNISKAKLLEISPVGFPAYPDSQVSTRGYNPFDDYIKKEVKRKRLILKTYL